mgnify:FL=1
MADIKWITIKEASELTGRQPRTIRYHLQKYKDSKPTAKELDNSIKYIQDRYDQKLLMINEAFIFKLYPSVKKRVAKGSAKGMQNDNAKGNAITMQQPTQPSVNEIEDLVQKRMQVMAEAHKREIDNLKSAHADYLERLDKGAINMMNNHENEITRLQQSNQQQIKQLTSDKQYLQLQLNTKDETVKVLLEEMKQLRIQASNTNTDFVQIEQVESTPEIEETNIINEDVSESTPSVDLATDKEPQTEQNEMDIDDAIAKGMTFAEWLSLKNK